MNHAHPITKPIVKSIVTEIIPDHMKHGPDIEYVVTRLRPKDVRQENYLMLTKFTDPT